jgi:hypothetical protein
MDIIQVITNVLGYIVNLLSNITALQLQTMEQLKAMQTKHKFRESIRQQYPMVHLVPCNNCAREFIVGPRYKCLFCENYNICQDCESLIGTDTQYNPYFIHDATHCFVKIRNSEGFERRMATNPPLFSACM